MIPKKKFDHTLKAVRDDFERNYIEHVLDNCWTQTDAAEYLGITREGLVKACHRLGLDCSREHFKQVRRDIREREEWREE